MNSRERWTVYPLLFLALGLAVRSAAIPPDTFVTARIEGLDATRLVCREIVVQADDGTILVHIGRVVGGGGGGRKDRGPRQRWSGGCGSRDRSWRPGWRH